MRDIRNDLQERAALIEEQIRAAHNRFQKTLEELQNERDARIADLKSGLAMIAKFMEFEQRSWGNVSPPVPSSPIVALADLFMHKLSEAGSMSREELVDLAVKEGFYPDADKRGAGCSPHACELGAKRVNSRIAERNVRASHAIASHQT